MTTTIETTKHPAPHDAIDAAGAAARREALEAHRSKLTQWRDDETQRHAQHIAKAHERAVHEAEQRHRAAEGRERARIARRLQELPNLVRVFSDDPSRATAAPIAKLLGELEADVRVTLGANLNLALYWTPFVMLAGGTTANAQAFESVIEFVGRARRAQEREPVSFAGVLELLEEHALGLLGVARTRVAVPGMRYVTVEQINACITSGDAAALLEAVTRAHHFPDEVSAT